jgi:5-methylcytosine-specific restriction endonuclease McrA
LTHIAKRRSKRIAIRYLEAEKVTLPSRAPLFVEEGHCQWCNKELTGRATRYCAGKKDIDYGYYSECAVSFLNWWCSRPAYVRATFIKDNFTCQECGLHPVRKDKPWLPDISQLECDHIIPVAKGGKTEMDNLQTLCKVCNRKKGISVPANQLGKLNPEQIRQDLRESIIKQGLEPLCGWPWLEENRCKQYPEQGITVFFKGKELVIMPSTSTKRGIIKSAMKMARST